MDETADGWGLEDTVITPVETKTKDSWTLDDPRVIDASGQLLQIAGASMTTWSQSPVLLKPNLSQNLKRRMLVNGKTEDAEPDPAGRLGVERR